MGKGSSFEIKLGTYRDKDYILTCKSVPSLNNPKEFAVMVSFFDRENERWVEIVRIDNAHGQEAHIHRLWRGEKDIEKMDWKGEAMELLSKAMDLLQKNWERYAELFESHRV